MQTGAIISEGLALTGAGGAFDLNLGGNDVNTFAAATGTLRFRDDNGFNVGTVPTLNGPVTGIAASGDVELTAASGSVTQDSDAPLQVGGILNLIGGTFNFGNVSNQIGTLSANGVSLSFRDDDGFSVVGITMTDTACLLSDGSVTQSAAIVADHWAWAAPARSISATRATMSTPWRRVGRRWCLAMPTASPSAR